MAIAWFICTYKSDSDLVMPRRYCAMDDYTPAIRADGGDWSESEVLGGYAVVKVRASQATLDDIAGQAGYLRVPLSRLDDPLSALSAQQRTALRNRLEAMGYSVEEITATLGNNLAQRTLGDVLRFAASRRHKPRHDIATNTIVLDGPIQSCRDISDVDRRVT